MNSEPVATVTYIGRNTYAVQVTHGVIVYGPDGRSRIVFGRQRAEKYARKLLARYLITQTPPAEPVITIRPVDLENPTFL